MKKGYATETVKIRIVKHELKMSLGLSQYIYNSNGKMKHITYRMLSKESMDSSS